MDFYQLISIIGFVLSSYLSISKIYSSFVRINIDILGLYCVSDIIYLKFTINNLSANPIAITRANLSNKTQGMVLEAYHFAKPIAYSVSKTNGVKESERFLTADKVPVNVSQKSAISVYFAFPLKEIDLIDFSKGILSLDLKINGKFFSSEFSYLTKNCPTELLLKEVKR